MEANGGVIVKGILIANTFGSASDCNENKLFPVLDDVLMFTVEPFLPSGSSVLVLVAGYICREHSLVSSLYLPECLCVMNLVLNAGDFAVDQYSFTRFPMNLYGLFIKFSLRSCVS